MKAVSFRFVVVLLQASAADACVTRSAGEYFLSESAKLDRVREERKVKQEEAMGAKAKQVRCSAAVPPCIVRASR